MGLRAWLRRRRIGGIWRRMATWWYLYTTRFAYPVLIHLPPGQQILTLSPHPDDDVISIGGTLLKHSQGGCRLTTLVLTDGAAGTPDQRRREVAQIRRREEEAAAGRLGIERVLFWDEPDGALAENKANAERLRGILREVQPDLVYLPSFLDYHPDHRVVTPLLARAVEGTDLSFACAIYETNSPIVPNVLVDISAQMETKLQAVAEHRSQLQLVDYVDLVRTLGRTRTGAFSRRVQYVEALFMESVHGYLTLWRQASQG
jgi:LmbE family N-acetylglucosaminyl deacetylase